MAIHKGQLSEQVELSFDKGTNFSSVGNMETAKISDFTTGLSTTFGDTGTLGGVISISETTPINGNRTFEYQNNATAGSSDNDWVKVTEIVTNGYKGRQLELRFQYQNEYASTSVKIKAIDSNGKVHIDEFLPQYVDTTDSTAQEFSQRLSVLPGVTTITWGLHVIVGEADKKVRIDDVVLTPELRTIAETIVTEKPDSMARHTGLVAKGSSAGAATLTMPNLAEYEGSAIAYQQDTINGDTWTILEDGLYHISANLLFNDSVGTGYHSFFKNISDITLGPTDPIPLDQRLTMGSKPSAAYGGGTSSWSGLLKKGDVITWRVSGEPLYTGGATNCHFTIAKKGSYELTKPLIDQKMNLETSTLVMNTPNFRGSVDIKIAGFGNFESIDGEALSFSNTPENGFILTVLKDGLLTLNLSIDFAGGSSYGFTLNDPSLATEIFNMDPQYVLAYEEGAMTNGLTDSLSWSGNVREGDVIRIKTQLVPQATGLDASLLKFTAFYVNPEVSVNINTVTPQYEDTDSCIMLNTFLANGTTNTMIPRFASVVKNKGNSISYISSITDGDSFEILESGIYHISTTVYSQGGHFFGVTINSTELTTSVLTLLDISKRINLSFVDNDTDTSQTSVYLNTGDIVRVHTSGVAPSSGQDRWHFTIAKQANPSIVGIDGKPIEAYIQEENSEIVLTGSNGTGSTRTSVGKWTTVASNKGSALSLSQSAVNGDEIEVLEDGMYSIDYTDFDTDGGSFGITVNTTLFTSPPQSISYADGGRGHAYLDTGTRSGAVSRTLDLRNGDIIRACNSGVAGSVTASFAVTKIGSLKSQVPISEETVDIPTSELRLGSVGGYGSTNTKIVRYTSIEKLTGDALTVANDSATGTEITVNKDGILHIEYMEQFTVESWVGLSRNSTELTTAITSINAEDILAMTYVAGGNQATNICVWSGKVYEGDVIRPHALGDTIGGFAKGSKIQAIHQENKASISISNLDPQFEDYDSTIRLNSFNGYGSSAINTARWSKITQLVRDAIEYVDSSVLGSSFTAKKNGTYHISFSLNTPTDGWAYPSLTLNSSNLSAGPTALPTDEVLALAMHLAHSGTNQTANVAWSGYLREGDVIRPQTTGATPLSADRCFFTMSYAGKPSLTSVDVTKFADVSKRTSQEITHSASENTLLNISDEIKFDPTNVNFKGSSILRMDQQSTKTEFVAKENCTVGVSLNLNPNVAGHNARIWVNGTQVGGGDAVNTAGYSSSASYHGILNKGDVLTVGTGVATFSSGNAVYLSILAQADAVTTIAEVEYGTQLCKYTGYTTNVLVGSYRHVLYTTHVYNKDGNQEDTTSLFSYDNSSGYTKFTASKDCFFAVTSFLKSNSPGQSLSNLVLRYNSSGTLVEVSNTNSQDADVNWSIGVMNSSDILVNKGDYVVIGYYSTDEAPISADNRVSVKATPLKAEALVSIPRKKVAILKDIKSSGVSGGDFISGAWRVRDINNLLGCTSFVSLSSNQFTLSSGTYYISWEAECFNVDRNQSKLYCVTDSAYVSGGESLSSAVGSTASNQSIGHCYIEVPLSSKVYELHHRGSSTQATNGFGLPASVGDEVYSQVVIEKMV